MNIINDDFFITNMEITNNDDLRDKIHEIHNYMRNNGIGYGLSSLKVFNFLYGLMKVEGYGLTDKIKFSELLELANVGSNKISETLDKYLSIICEDENPQIKELLYYEIPDDIRDEVYNNLIIEIHNIKNVEKSSQELLSGKIYEYFVGRDQTAISELGAYFTNRRIVNFILEKVAPKIKDDGNIPKMIDMFGGSGGFTTGYMNYLNKYNKIDWKSQLDRIYHYDINADVLKSAALELLCLSDGVIPKIGRNKNIQKINSFKHNFHSENKFDLILTNPPYGGDKKSTSGKKDKRDKIKNYIKDELLKLDKDNDKDKEIINYRKEQLKTIEAEEKMEKKLSDSQTVNLTSCSQRISKFAYKNKLIGNDKEACSLILMMELLEADGVAVGVLKEGLFFDGKYKDLRKYLIEKYNIREIISVPQNQFENTSTKTSIIIFENSEIKTTEIKFGELNVELYENDKFIIDNNEVKLLYSKGDIKEVKEINKSSVSINKILNNDNYSLNSKDYNKVSIIPGEGFELVKIKDICEFQKYKSQKEDIDGIFNYYSCSSIIKKCNNPNINGEFVLLGTRGTIIEALHYINGEFGCNNNMLIFNAKNNNIYLYYIIKIIKVLIKTLITGSTIPMISKEKFQELEIPIPKTSELLEYWENKISQPFMKKQEKEIRFNELEEEIKNKIKDIQENHECEQVKLGDICEFIKTGKNKTPDDKKGTLYPYYGTSNITGYTNYYLFDGHFILLARNGTMGNCFLVKGKIYPSDHIFIIKNNKHIDIMLLYYIIKNLSSIIDKLSNGSTIKGISKVNLENIKIKIPKDKSLIDNLQPLFNEVEELQKEIKELNETYNNYLNELSKAAITNQEILNTNEEELKEEIHEEHQEEPKEEIQEETTSIKSNKSQTIEQLKEQCKTLGIKGYSKKKKDELIELIKNHK
jgi:type I restriction-modification system DNA methylase subunit